MELNVSGAGKFYHKENIAVLKFMKIKMIL